MTESIEKQVGILAAVESERHFIEVSRKVLGANLVPRPHDSPLQEREGAFNRIGMHVANCVDALAVVDGLVSVSELSDCSWVSRTIVSHNHVHIFGDVLSDVLCERAFPCVRSMEESEVAVALADSDDNFLFSLGYFLASPNDLSADIGFIHLDRSIEHLLFYFHHCCADAMAEIPRRLVAAKPESALNLASTHALLGLAEQQGSQEPLCKGQVRVVEDRPGHHSELVITILAVVESLFGFKLDGGLLTAWALDAFRPAQASQNLPALLIGREHGVYVN